ncbi:MAG: MBL fold metallo-hydrolase [Polyangiales bacterium]
MSARDQVKVGIVPVTPFQQNCSVVRCEATGKAAIVDPGGDLEDILSALTEMEATPEKILVTHGHLDHAGGVAELAERLGIPVEGPHREDAFLIDTMASQARMFGFGSARGFTPDRWLEQGDEVKVGELVFEVRHCPGHTPGHVIFLLPEAKLAFVGDVLFQGSIGRTDFPRGDLRTLLDSIAKQLLSLDDDVAFVSGHGPTSTIGRERRTNPFLDEIA